MRALADSERDYYADALDVQEDIDAIMLLLRERDLSAFVDTALRKRNAKLERVAEAADGLPSCPFCGRVLVVRTPRGMVLTENPQHHLGCPLAELEDTHE